MIEFSENFRLAHGLNAGAVANVEYLVEYEARTQAEAQALVDSYESELQLEKRKNAYQMNFDAEFLNLLCDDVLPQLMEQLSADAQEKITACLAARQSIKQRYPKPV
ncbi:hypothetical protein [Pseudoalteromonas aurantia]|uniref:Uncharacterized protein n=1 Tax=Pseudoalteromonas aurantia TaxID=43654 RepID=A0A5S3V273_9GAMM|nr:hypothetical protein [Pseudoalteromonas aurantia]TMO64443.1 hypothetical protein CWC19_18400 [Pseudoalteromonas aurantia]TMO75334.1 hypothetical protein CWC20_08410 [Pseudoalteromonas aurantia]